MFSFQDFNVYLLDNYSIPSWVSYVLFAIVTILMGALIGLLFVCIVDLVFPPKHLQRKSFAQSSEAILNSNDDIPEDDLDDLSSSEGGEEDNKKQQSPSSSPSKKKSKGKKEENEKGGSNQFRFTTFADNRKTSDTEPTVEDMANDDDTVKVADVRKRRTRKAD